MRTAKEFHRRVIELTRPRYDIYRRQVVMARIEAPARRRTDWPFVAFAVLVVVGFLVVCVFGGEQ